MPAILEVLGYAIVAGVGYGLGYQAVNLLYAQVHYKIQTKKLENELLKMSSRPRLPQPGVPTDTNKKLCTKCKLNPRPKGGLYCKSCQFSGDKFR